MEEQFRAIQNIDEFSLFYLRNSDFFEKCTPEFLNWSTDEYFLINLITLSKDTSNFLEFPHPDPPCIVSNIDVLIISLISGNSIDV